MTHAELFAWVYGQATGRLGWSHEVAMTTPLPMVWLALEGAVEWNKALWGGGKRDDKKARAALNKARMEVTAAKVNAARASKR